MHSVEPVWIQVNPNSLPQVVLIQFKLDRAMRIVHIWPTSQLCVMCVDRSVNEYLTHALISIRYAQNRFCFLVMWTWSTRSMRIECELNADRSIWFANRLQSSSSVDRPYMYLWVGVDNSDVNNLGTTSDKQQLTGAKMQLLQATTVLQAAIKKTMTSIYIIYYNLIIL